MIKVLEILKRKYVFSEKYIKFIESIFVSIGTPYIPPFEVTHAQRFCLVFEACTYVGHGRYEV